MILFLTGSGALPASAQQRLRPNAVSFAGETPVAQFLGRALSSSDLFGEPLQFRVAGVPNAELAPALLKLLPRFKESANEFVFFVPSVVAALKPFVAETGATEIPLEKQTARKELPLVFDLADAYAAGDRKRAWGVWLRLAQSGASGEEVAGTLIWNLKQILAAHHMKKEPAADFGMKPYTLGKAKAAAAKVSEAKALEDYRALVRGYHLAHDGSVDLGRFLERFVLERI